jgi:hypothetical protein
MLVFRGKNINIAPKKEPFLSRNPMFILVSRGPTRAVAKGGLCKKTLWVKQ